MPITPDTKDWTWVLERRCPECGFAVANVDFDDIPGILTDVASKWPVVLARPDARLRPDDHTWSPLEYGAHVRDVFRIFTLRLGLMLDEDDPLFPNWDQDATAQDERYNEQDPGVVAGELVDAAAVLAAAFGSVPEEARHRPGRRSDGAAFTVTTLGKYLVHDPVHHLHDVGVE
ncbi:MAG: Methyltransferase type 12 [Cryobacterium sp.]|jgi:hypothetical protein|nr:Methyltransferase type 12 [Cryobacterium sp.]